MKPDLSLMQCKKTEKYNHFYFKKSRHGALNNIILMASMLGFYFKIKIRDTFQFTLAYFCSWGQISHTSLP